MRAAELARLRWLRKDTRLVNDQLITRLSAEG
jgi:hypothetical protein